MIGSGISPVNPIFTETAWARKEELFSRLTAHVKGDS